MALTESNMLPLGTQAPEFMLIDVVDEKIKSLNELKGNNGTIVVFMCNHCPYVVHLLDEFVALAKKNIAHGIQTIAISSNDVENYPDDHPDKMKQLSIKKEFSFPYLYDEDQSIAKAYEAACTPDFYLMEITHLYTEVVLTLHAQEIIAQLRAKIYNWPLINF